MKSLQKIKESLSLMRQEIINQIENEKSKNESLGNVFKLKSEVVKFIDVSPKERQAARAISKIERRKERLKRIQGSTSEQ